MPKPDIWSPVSTFNSLTGREAKNQDIIQALIDVVESLSLNDKLKGADLLRADLLRTNISLEQLQSAKVFRNTILPDDIDKTQIKFEDDK
ncbi:MAG: hypothetical protein ACI9UO_002612 [Nitrospinales bacterium]